MSHRAVTDAQTDAGNDNTRMPKLASGKNGIYVKRILTQSKPSNNDLRGEYRVGCDSVDIWRGYII